MPFIILTESHDKDIVRLGKLLGATDFLVKSVGGDELCFLIEKRHKND